MIKINLLIKPPPLVRWRVVAQIAGAAGLIGVVGIAGYSAAASLRSKAIELAETQKLLAAYRQAAGRLAPAQAEVEQLQQMQAEYAKLQRNQLFSQSAVLRQIRVTPAGVALTEIAFSPSEVVIAGEAKQFAGAMQYLAYLRSVPLFSQVAEVTAQTDETGATDFTFKARFKGEVKQP
jgi:Tfp pilus assembly protein PilN